MQGLLDLFGGLGAKIAAGAVALVAFGAWIWNGKRKAVKEARQEDELKGRQTRDEVEDDIASRSDADVRDRLSKWER